MRKLDTTTKRLLRDPEKRWAWIIYQLALQDDTLATIARAAGVTRQCIYKAARGRYPRMEAIIATALDMTPTQLFPERYSGDGLPKKQRGGVPDCCQDNTTTDGTPRNIYNGQAA
jgi:lambda repressor-like predicted transcriptional regulator